MTTDTAVAATGRRHGTFHPLRVSAVERLTDDAVAITFEVPDDLRDAYAFVAGQHLTVRTVVDGEEVRRNYSICAPATSGRLRIGVKRLAGGVFSGHATSTLRVGDTVDVMTPTGRFFTPLDPANAKHYCALAAGSGITPVLSIVSTVLDVEPHSTVTLVYGNRTTASVMFLEELADLKDRHPTRFRLVNVLSREPQEVELFSGRIDADKVRALLATLFFSRGVPLLQQAPRAAITQSINQLAAALSGNADEPATEAATRSRSWLGIWPARTLRTMSFSIWSRMGQAAMVSAMRIVASPSAVISNSSPVWTPACSSGVMTLG